MKIIIEDNNINKEQIRDSNTLNSESAGAAPDFSSHINTHKSIDPVTHNIENSDAIAAGLPFPSLRDIHEINSSMLSINEKNVDAGAAPDL